MNIGIYDPYLDTMGGGEKYMLTAASCLSKNNNVSIFWEQKSVQEIKKIANSRFGFDLSSIRFTKNIFSKNISFLERHTQLRKYDAIFYLSDGSIPLLLSRKLVLHFQFPVNWVCASLLTRTKFASIKNVVCNSYYTKKYIDKTFSTKSIVVYPPANDYEFKKIPKKNIILTVGRFNPMPGGGNFKKLDVMITIFKEMIDTGAKNWELYVVASFKKQEEGEIAKLEETVENYPIFIMKNIPYEKLNDFLYPKNLDNYLYSHFHLFLWLLIHIQESLHLKIALISINSIILIR